MKIRHVREIRKCLITIVLVALCSISLLLAWATKNSSRDLYPHSRRPPETRNGVWEVSGFHQHRTHSEKIPETSTATKRGEMLPASQKIVNSENHRKAPSTKNDSSEKILKEHDGFEKNKGKPGLVNAKLKVHTKKDAGSSKSMKIADVVNLISGNDLDRTVLHESSPENKKVPGSEKKTKPTHKTHQTKSVKYEKTGSEKTVNVSNDNVGILRGSETTTTKLTKVTPERKSEKSGRGSEKTSTVEKEKSEVTSSEKNTRCLRPNHEAGVQDLFCVKKPEYLKNVKNPCWFEETGHIRCLPYFHILGCGKCCSTDLYSRMCIHPQIVQNTGLFGKEALWWSWSFYGIYGNYTKYRPKPLSHYIQMFQPVAEQIEEAMNTSHTEDLARLITGDASPPDLWDFRGWPLLPQNHRSQEPVVLTPHLMKHLYRDPKFIILFRNPTDRLYSDFFFLRGGKTAEDFHRAVEQSLALLEKCQTRFSIRRCFYSADIYRRLKTRIHYGCYSVFLREWLDVFPLRHFLFLKTEEYIANITNHLEKIYSFLGLERLSEQELDKVSKKSPVRVNEVRQRAGPMLDKTRKLLDHFYRPFTEDLAHILKDNRYLWNETNQVSAEPDS